MIHGYFPAFEIAILYSSHQCKDIVLSMLRTNGSTGETLRDTQICLYVLSARYCLNVESDIVIKIINMRFSRIPQRLRLIYTKRKPPKKSIQGVLGDVIRIKGVDIKTTADKSCSLKTRDG